MSRLLQLQSSSRRSRAEALLGARERLDPVGASSTAIKHCAEKASVLSFEAEPKSVDALLSALDARGISVHDAPSFASEVACLAAHDCVTCTLELLYVGDERARVDSIPTVPG